MKIQVLGVRGMPNVQGGVETHAQQLYQRLADMGCEVEVIVRSPFVPREQRMLGSIRLTRLWSPRRPGFEALVHSLLGVAYAGVTRPDILHIHAVGPSIVTPIARLFGLRVVVTHHGPDYDRDKWGRFARYILRLGERLGTNYSHARIAISKVIADLLWIRYGKSSELISNGVANAAVLEADDQVRRFGLTPGRYFLMVSRIVPEKRQLDLIRAFAQARPEGWKLALVGGLAADAYSREVEAAARSADVVMTGFLSGAPLQQMYSHAGAFVLPSSHEGLPIALLEALSYGLPVLASGIPANLEIGLQPSSYFQLGNTHELAGLINATVREGDDASRRAERIRWVRQRYDWDRIARDTLAIYQRLLSPKATAAISGGSRDPSPPHLLPSPRGEGSE